TGYLHVGGARTALFNWLFARRTGATFVLRIEDTDAARSSAEMVEGILASMRWMGLEWDEGPFYQSQRLDLYRAIVQKLMDADHAYRCYCTPEELNARRAQDATARQAWEYDGLCRSLSTDQKQQMEAEKRSFVVRFHVPETGRTEFHDAVFGNVAFSNEEIEDFVLLRSDGLPTYHLCVVADDCDMRITHVIRGADHLSNTPKHVLLYRALEQPLPVFAHLPLILGEDRSRLSKRHGATAVSAYRERGLLPEAFRNFLALLGWSPGDDRELMRTGELIQAFSLEAISKSNAVFNLSKLEWFNAEYMQMLTAEELAPMAEEALQAAGCWDASWEGEGREWFLRALELLQPRLRTLQDLSGPARAYFRDDYPLDPAAVGKFWKDPLLANLLPVLAEDLAQLPQFNEAEAEKVLRALAANKGVQAGLLINASRVALTGQAVAPSLFAVMELLGQEKTVARLRAARSQLPSQAG
ncbi:MAG: glutamate--tRNA ligase, partial [Acidobacteria bacterium]|nr:glutamate--tRNA ligase [Acidobacteriota bacterium]